MSDNQQSKSAFLARLAASCNTNPSMLGNPELHKGKVLRPVAAWPGSPHRKLQVLSKNKRGNPFQTDFSALVIGETISSADGMCLGAVGNTSSEEPITDHTNVKLQIGVRVIDGGSGEWDDFLQDQEFDARLLESFLVGGPAALNQLESTPGSIIRHIFCKISTTDTDFSCQSKFPRDVGMFILPGLYTHTPRGKGTTNIAPQVLTRSNRKRDADDNTKDEERIVEESFDVAKLRVTPSKVGQEYDPRCLLDYGFGKTTMGLPKFQHVKAKLVQLDVCDPNGALIPPWRLSEFLAPGAIVMMHIV